MKAKIFTILIIASLFFVGCAGTKNLPITDSCANELKHHTVACADNEAPDFKAHSAGKSMAGGAFGLIGAAIAHSSMVSEGNKIISENGVEDPAGYIAEQLMSGLVAQYQLNQVHANSAPVQSDDIEHISSLYKNADYVLDVKTVNWLTVPGRVVNRYRVVYGSQLRLIDTNERKVVAEGFCSETSKSSDPDFSYDELMGNNAEGLKNQLKEKAEYCVDHFKKNVFMVQ